MMDWLVTWRIVQTGFAVGSVLLMVISVIAIWRLRGIFNWRHSLRKEIESLSDDTETAGEARQLALELVRDRCQRVWRASSPDIKELIEISSYIRSIAACYHPGVEKPEWCVSVGRLINAAQALVHRMELILRLPGFQRLRRVRIRHVRESFEWYEQVKQNPLVQFLSRYLKGIRRLFRFRLVIFPDPFTWLAYFSNRLTMLTLAKCLLVDLYLFVGKTAIEAYDEEENQGSFADDIGELEKTLEELGSLKATEIDISDSRVLEIRNRLVGFPFVVRSSPGIEEWKEAVRQTADLIAKKHFPGSAHPLEEAALGPLLARTRFWVKSLCETEGIPIVKSLHRMRIDSLYQVKSFTESLLPKRAWKYIGKGWELYGWLKWPLKVYRSVKKGSPVGVAMGVGWVAAKRAFSNIVCRYTFDMAYKELEMVYSESRSFPYFSGKRDL